METSSDTLDPGLRQIAVEEGRDGLAGLRDLVVVVEGVRNSRDVGNPGAPEARGQLPPMPSWHGGSECPSWQYY